MRYRIKFAKTEAMRYTGNLDLHRTLERTMRRADLPLAYSEGFRPHPRLTLASALPLGFTSQDEWAEFWLQEPLEPEQVEEKFRAASPPGILLKDVQLVEKRAPKLQNVVVAAEYLASLLEPLPDLESKVGALLAADELMRERRAKKKGKLRSYDLRPLILDLQTRPPDEEGYQQLYMQLSVLPNATGRPDEVLRALDYEPHQARVERTHLQLQDS